MAGFWKPKLGERFAARLLCQQCRTTAARGGSKDYSAEFCSDECFEAGQVKDALTAPVDWKAKIQLHHTAVKLEKDPARRLQQHPLRRRIGGLARILAVEP